MSSNVYFKKIEKSKVIFCVLLNNYCAKYYIEEQKHFFDDYRRVHRKFSLETPHKEDACVSNWRQIASIKGRG